MHQFSRFFRNLMFKVFKHYLKMSLLTTTLFAQNAVYPLTSDDFNINSSAPITMKWDDCMLVLFYGNNQESIDLAKIWQLVASSTAGPLFGACNIIVHRSVAEAFTKIKAHNSPLRSFALKGFPTIITYQGGWPVGVYNGERAVQPIVDYAMTLACNADYLEPQQLFKGVQVDNDYEMAGVKYHKPYTSSVQFVNGDSFRGFDARQPVVLTGTPAAAQEARQLQVEQRQEGIIPIATSETPQETEGSGIQPLSTSEAAQAQGQAEFTPNIDEPITPGEETRRSEEGEVRTAEESGTPVPEVIPIGQPIPTLGAAPRPGTSEQEAGVVAAQETQEKAQELQEEEIDAERERRAAEQAAAEGRSDVLVPTSEGEIEEPVTEVEQQGQQQASSAAAQEQEVEQEAPIVEQREEEEARREGQQQTTEEEEGEARQAEQDLGGRAQEVASNTTTGIEGEAERLAEEAKSRVEGELTGERESPEVVQEENGERVRTSRLPEGEPAIELGDAVK